MANTKFRTDQIKHLAAEQIGRQANGDRIDQRQGVAAGQINGDQVIVGSLSDAVGEASGAAYVFPIGCVSMALVEYADFQNCFSGEGGEVFSNCKIFDLDNDNDVDVADYGRFWNAFVGP